MPRIVMLAAVAMLSAIATAATAQDASMPGHQSHPPMSSADAREQLHFPSEMEVHFLGNMREHMQTLNNILQAITVGDLTGASRIAAERLGLNSPSAAACKPSADSGTANGPSAKPPKSADPSRMPQMMAAYTMDEMMTLFMPEPMRAMGLSMHTAASEFAAVAARAAASHDTLAAVAALSNVTQNCVACHTAYRVR